MLPHKISLALAFALVLALCAASDWRIVLDAAARGTSTLTPASLVIDVGDTVTWVWTNNTIIHEIATENRPGPRCRSDQAKRSWWAPSPVYRGNVSAYTWTVAFPEPGTWNYLCTSTPPLSGLYHCLGKDMRGMIVVRSVGRVETIHEVALDPVARTFTPSSLTIAQGDIVRWTWARGPITALGNIITEGTSLCAPYNSTRSNSSAAFWSFPESPVFWNNGLWTPQWSVKFTTAGTFPYFSANAGDFTGCLAGFRGVITVLPCTPNVNCEPAETTYPTPVPLGLDPVDPDRRVKGIDNWLLWTTVAFLCVLGLLIIATVVACVIGAKKSDSPMIALCLLPNETPSWATIKI
jgi:plastocyanin